MIRPGKNGLIAYIGAVALVCGVAIPTMLMAQTEIPLGTWRMHLSYRAISAVAVSEAFIFAAQESGIIVLERATGTIRTLNKLNGLSGSGITALAYDAPRSQLLIAYEDGGLDIIRHDEVTAFGILKTAPVTGSKKINHMFVRDGEAYLSVPYGVVRFDLQALEIRETWRDLGVAGQPLAVNKTAFYNDSIFLATDNGILAGAVGDNLLDFNNWKRFQTGPFAGVVKSVAVFDGAVFATGATGVYRYQGGTWVKEPFLADEAVTSMDASGASLMMIAGATLWQVGTDYILLQVADPLITSPVMAMEDDAGMLWIGDRSSGLVSDAGGAFVSYLPDGPSISDPFRLASFENKVWMLAGGFTDSGAPENITGRLDVFENGRWTITTYPLSDLTDVAARSGQVFVSSFGEGLLATDQAGNVVVLDETNSPLQNITGDAANITAMLLSPDGLWVANDGGNESLHLYKTDNGWNSYSFPFPNAMHPTDVVADREGTLWMPLRPASGGGLLAFNPGRNEAILKTVNPGNGALPDPGVNAVSADRDGIIWIGTNSGVAYFLSLKQDATKPIFESRFLLRGEKISAIAVDGGNRKWIGTNDGVWLFDATGETLLLRFTEENSPLLSNTVRDIAINNTTGEVFFGTDKGLVSYRADATTAGPRFQDLRIFPNPVAPGYGGNVGISGLASDAIIKITDVSGRLLWQTQANGGTATWNMRDPQGRRAPTGVYLVFAATADGTESLVGKIAVIE